MLAPEGLRDEVTLEDVAPVAREAVVAEVDHRFYEHGESDDLLVDDHDDRGGGDP